MYLMRKGIMMLLLVSCMPSFSKEGASPRELDAAMTECEVSAQQAGYFGGVMRVDFVTRCMRGKGWKADD